MMGVRLMRLALAFALVSLVAGCSAKKKPGTADDGSGLSDQKLPGSSLEAFESGRRPPATDAGPLRDLHFSFDSYELDEGARQVLRENADWLKDNPSTRVEIEGHCDERGTVEYNLALGAKRARAAKDYLTTLGISADRMSTISYGEELPLCSEHTEACWADNRRCHFVQLN